jgi:hypothetical protein
MARNRLARDLEPCPRANEWTRSQAEDQEKESTQLGMAGRRRSLVDWGSNDGGGAARAHGGQQARACGGATGKFTIGGEYVHDLHSSIERKGEEIMFE